MSFYLKILGSFFVVCSSTMVGFALSKKLKVRKDFLMSFQDFLCNLQANIRYSCDDIFSLINKSLTNDYLSVFISDNKETFCGYWNKSIEEIPSSYGLTHEDYNLLRDFGVVLGVTDVEGQISHIELYKTLFETQLEKAETQQNSKSKLYKVMGFFVGSVAVLMII